MNRSKSRPFVWLVVTLISMMVSAASARAQGVVTLRSLAGVYYGLGEANTFDTSGHVRLALNGYGVGTVAIETGDFNRKVFTVRSVPGSITQSGADFRAQVGVSVLNLHLEISPSLEKPNTVALGKIGPDQNITTTHSFSLARVPKQIASSLIGRTAISVENPAGAAFEGAGVSQLPRTGVGTYVLYIRGYRHVVFHGIVTAENEVLFHQRLPDGKRFQGQIKVDAAQGGTGLGSCFVIGRKAPAAPGLPPGDEVSPMYRLASNPYLGLGLRGPRKAESSTLRMKFPSGAEDEGVIGISERGAVTLPSGWAGLLRQNPATGLLSATLTSPSSAGATVMLAGVIFPDGSARGFVVPRNSPLGTFTITPAPAVP